MRVTSSVRISSEGVLVPFSGSSIQQSAFKRRSAFSLFEVLVVMAFLALITGIVTLNFDKIIPAVQEKPIDRVFIESLQDARILAATTGNEVAFRFDSAEEAFVLEERKRKNPIVEDEPEDYDSYAEPEHFEQSFGFEDADRTTVTFYRRISQPSDFSTRSNAYEDEPVRELIFHPSGASTPAKVVIRQPDLDDIEVELDPFSSGPLETDEQY